MANSTIEYRELRFVVEPEQTHCFAFIQQTDSDTMIGVTGWHHKVFPASMSVSDIMDTWTAGVEEPLLWPLNAPPSAPSAG
jgi:hypothetical protein